MLGREGACRLEHILLFMIPCWFQKESIIGHVFPLCCQGVHSQMEVYGAVHLFNLAAPSHPVQLS